MWTGDANQDARQLLNWIKGKGTNLHSQITDYSVLGKVLELLAKDCGVEEASQMLVLIKRHGLIRGKAILDQLKKECGIQ